MGKRQDNILNYINGRYDLSKPAIPTLADYKSSKWYKEIFKIYKELGGIQQEIPLGIKSKDLDFGINGKILEFDEENHFNRYRAITLKASIYNDNKAFDKSSYLQYCNTYENKCQARGKYWTNPSAEKQFGKSNSIGDLSGFGAARWKQRAFYDMLKDFIPYITEGKTTIKRISIYDTIEVNGNNILIDKILTYADAAYNNRMKQHIENLININQ